MLCDICRQNEAVSEFTEARSPEKIVSRHVCISCLGGWLGLHSAAETDAAQIDLDLEDLTDTTIEFYETPPP
jgi:protein-arginine kinase activator protein McsA